LYWNAFRLGSVAGVIGHDLRRTCAKLRRKYGGDLEQIQFLLGHSSIQSTEKYLGGQRDCERGASRAILQRLANVLWNEIYKSMQKFSLSVTAC